MSRKDYNILDDTFCIYCQRDFPLPRDLQKHVLTYHAGSYAANSILKAREQHGR
jgi:hypothetical protein